MDDTLTVSTESDGQQHKDTDPNTTTDESILTPVETNSNSTEASPSKDQTTSKDADKADTTPKKGALKTKSPKKDGLKFDLNGGDNAAADSDLEEVSSSSEDDADVASSKAAKKKKKLTRAKSKLKTKASKSPSAKEKKRAKQQLPTIDSDVETDESDSGDSDDDSDEDTQTPKVGLKKQVKALTEQLGQIQKQLAPSAAYPLPPFGASGYYPAQGAGYPYGYGPAIPSAVPSVAASRPATTSKSRKDVDPSRSRLESLFGSLSRFPSDILGLPGLPAGYRGPRFTEDDEELTRDRKSKKPVRPDFKRVDSVWDGKMHNFRLKDTVENVDDAGYDRYVFHVRRTFDFENKYRSTIIDIKSKLLRECLQDVIGNVKGFSLVDETPKIPPNMLFL